MTHHTQVQASRALVDEGMVSLLELLWERGYETEFSCQGGQEWTRNIGGETKVYHTTDAYLVFTDFEDGVRFLHEVYDANSDTGEFALQLKLSKVGPGLGVIPRAHLTWYHTHTEAIFQGLMSATVNA